MKKGYFFCGDLLGFSDIVQSLNNEDLDKQIKKWVDLVQSAANKHNINQYQLVSDTLFATSSRLELLISFAQYLLNEGIQLSLPIRGAITYGELTWSNIVYGKAVIEAHKLEMRQNWIGITIDTKVPFRKSYDELSLVCYPIPGKELDKIMLFPAVEWNIPPYKDIVRYLTMNGLGGTPGVGKELNWDWAIKVQNTILFKLYLKAIKLNSNYKPDKYYSTLPIEIIEMNFLRDKKRWGQIWPLAFFEAFI